jgi:hypothetical protein
MSSKLLLTHARGQHSFLLPRRGDQQATYSTTWSQLHVWQERQFRILAPNIKSGRD